MVVSTKIEPLINHLKVKFFTLKTVQAAKRLVDAFITSPEDRILLPFTDHPGPISDEILQRRFSSLTVCERDEESFTRLSSYVKERCSSKVINLYNEDIIDLSYKDYCETSQKRCSDIIRKTLSPPQTLSNFRDCDTKVKFLVPLLKNRNEVGLLTNIYYQMCMKVGLCSEVLIHYYFLMSDRQYGHINAKPGRNLSLYRSSSVLCNTIFNVHRLESFDLDCFQIELNQIQSTAKSTASSYPEVHLVHLEPKTKLINNLNAETMLAYRFFVHQMMMRRTRLVNVFLEQWFGKLNGEITHFGITNATRTGDLTAEQYLNLFIFLQNRPEYKKSLFTQAAAGVETRLSFC